MKRRIATEVDLAFAIVRSEAFDDTQARPAATLIMIIYVKVSRILVILVFFGITHVQPMDRSSGAGFSVSDDAAGVAGTCYVRSTHDEDTAKNACRGQAEGNARRSHSRSVSDRRYRAAEIAQYLVDNGLEISDVGSILTSETKPPYTRSWKRSDALLMMTTRRSATC